MKLQKMQGGEKTQFNCVNGIASGGQKNCERKDFELCLQSLGSEYSQCAWHNGMEDFLNSKNNFLARCPLAGQGSFLYLNHYFVCL
jgi:hypothetical protein